MENELTQNEKDLLESIKNGDNPTCLHILGQSLSDTLSNIIRKLAAAQVINVTNDCEKDY